MGRPRKNPLDLSNLPSTFSPEGPSVNSPAVPFGPPEPLPLPESRASESPTTTRTVKKAPPEKAVPPAPIANYTLTALGEGRAQHVSTMSGTPEQVEAAVMRYYMLGIPVPTGPNIIEYRRPLCVTVMRL